VARARRSLAGGVTSSWQIARPQPVWISHGAGSRVWDVDGNQYVDLHGGYGVMAVGHAHPRVVAAVSERVRRGTHFAQPTEEAIAVAEELARRFRQPLWRFANSGTEATMDAVHLMRAITGRSRIVKVEGCYHGHHDSVQVSVYPAPSELGPAERPASAAASSGIPAEMIALTSVDMLIVDDFALEFEIAAARFLHELRTRFRRMIERALEDRPDAAPMFAHRE